MDPNDFLEQSYKDAYKGTKRWSLVSTNPSAKVQQYTVYSTLFLKECTSDIQQTTGVLMYIL